MDLGHGAHGGARVVRGGFLFDGDRRAQALDHIHIGLVHQLQKLPCIGGQALHVAPLPFGVQGVKGQAGLTRTAQAGDHHQLVAGYVDVDVLEVVGARTADADLAGVQGLGQAGMISVRLGHGFGWRGQPCIIGAGYRIKRG